VGEVVEEVTMDAAAVAVVVVIGLPNVEGGCLLNMEGAAGHPAAGAVTA
jgi:hypothetical protein